MPRYTINVWNKFSFRNGVYVAGGANGLGETYEHPSWTVPIKSEPVILFDAVLGCVTRLHRLPVDLRVNARNLANTRYLNGTFQYGEPRTLLGTVTLRF